MKIALVQLIVRNVTGGQLSYQREVDVEIVRVSDILKCLLQKLVPGVADDFAKGVVDLGKFAAQSNQGHPDRGGFKGATETLLAFSHLTGSLLYPNLQFLI